MEDGWHGYLWVHEIEVVSICLVSGGRDRVLGRLALESGSERLATFVEAKAAQDHSGFGYVAKVDLLAGWTAILEPIGFSFTTEAEAVGGFGIIDAADLDEALAVARSWPLGGYVEIRPLKSPARRADVVGYPHQPVQRGQSR